METRRVKRVVERVPVFEEVEVRPSWHGHVPNSLTAATMGTLLQKAADIIPDASGFGNEDVVKGFLYLAAGTSYACAGGLGLSVGFRKAANYFEDRRIQKQYR